MFILIMKLYIFILIFLIRDISANNCISENNNPSCTINYVDSTLQLQMVYSEDNRLNFALSLILTLSIMIMYYLLICYGFGVYRQTYENLQLISLIAWRQFKVNGLPIVTITNLGIPAFYFTQSVGTQFILVLIFIFIFYLMLSFIQNFTHNSYATLFKRKTIIFPFRLYTNFYNIFMFCALQQTKVIYKSELTSVILTVLAFIYLIIGLIGLLVLINFFQPKNDDPRYYIICERQIGNKIEKKNQILFSLINRFVIIITFVLSDNNITTIIIVILFQILYTLYYSTIVQFTKVRYFIINLFSNFLMIPLLLCALLSSNIAWIVLMFIYQVVFVLYLVIQIFANMMQIKRQLRSIYYRFILCQNSEQDILLNKYDSNYNKQKVLEFIDNPLHNKQIKEVNIEFGL